MRYLRFNDLKKAGIVRDRHTLSRWIRENGFPLGKVLGPHSLAWEEEAVRAWLDGRPAGGTSPSRAKAA